MIRDITIGQYFPAESWIHKLDPRVKIMSTLIFIIALFVANRYIGYLLHLFLWPQLFTYQKYL